MRAVHGRGGSGGGHGARRGFEMGKLVEEESLRLRTGVRVRRRPMQRRGLNGRRAEMQVAVPSVASVGS